MVKRPKRPRDPNQLAKLIVDITTGDVPNDSPKGSVDEETEWRRKGGRKGAKARAKKLTPARRRAIAKKAAAARWRRSSLP